MFKIPFLQRREQSLTEANGEEMRDAIENLVAFSTHDYGYYLFLILSILITTAGLLLNSPAVLIGGMIIAPFLTPLLGCGLALLLLEWKGAYRSFSILVISTFVSIILASFVTVLSPYADATQVVVNYLPERIPPSLYLIIAISSGVAGAYAFVKPHLSASMSGVAVSVSLVPPLCAVGVGFALKDTELVQQSFLIFSLNVLGIILAAVCVFWILGFRKMHRYEKKLVEDANNGD